MVKLITYICFKIQILIEAYVIFNAKQIIEEYDAVKWKEVAIETPPDNSMEGRTGMP